MGNPSLFRPLHWGHYDSRKGYPGIPNLMPPPSVYNLRRKKAHVTPSKMNPDQMPKAEPVLARNPKNGRGNPTKGKTNRINTYLVRGRKEGSCLRYQSRRELHIILATKDTAD